MSTNPAECDRTTVYAGECRNFADSEWIRFDSGRRRSPDARDGNTWLIDVAYGSFWMSDDKVRNLVPLVPAGGQWTRDDIEKALDVGIRGTTDGGLVGQDTSIPSGECVRLAVDAVCDLLGIEAEQAVDPVEELAEELMRVLAPETEDRTWGILTEPAREDFRRLARHVLGQEADQ